MSELEPAVPPDLFLGLVTHPASQRLDARAEDGTALALCDLLKTSGFRVEFALCNENLLTAEMLELSQLELKASIAAELSAETRWRVYLNPMTNKLRLMLEIFLRKWYRRVWLLRPLTRTLAPDSSGAKMLKRLANIELAHLSLLRQAVQSEAPWALILEDDALASDTGETADALARFLTQYTGEFQPKYVNVSESFSANTLGIKGLGKQVGVWAEGISLLSMEKPVTNTVCAILHSRAFMLAVVDEFESIPLKPVIPIDWKLNVAIMNLVEKGELLPGDCWQVDPAPFVQGSMHLG